MKNFINKALIVSSLLVSATVLTGCGAGSSNNSANNNNNNGQYVGPNNNQNQACGNGYYFYNNQCYPINGNGQFIPPQYNYTDGFYADNYSQTSVLRVTNATQLKQFFKFAMGVCDRAAFNYGTASCDSYANSYMDIIIQFPNANISSMLATFIARPRFNPYGNYSAQMPSGWGLLGIAAGYVTGVTLPDPKGYYGAQRNPLQLEMAVSAINNSTGFEARGYGDFWTGANTTLLSIQVPQGKVQDNQLNFNFKVAGKEAAVGTMSRCRTMNCGL